MQAYANLMVLHVYKTFSDNKLTTKPKPDEHCLDKQLSRMEKDWPKGRLWPTACVASDRPAQDPEEYAPQYVLSWWFSFLWMGLTISIGKSSNIAKKLGRNRRDLILTSRALKDAHVDVWEADDSTYAP